ncbi:EG45-like domain containing protein 2 [Cucurbita pepo subsp. pepo]|uniref:EG45-like domain containing protein 2 n=1 Tax=Cucurbita pepo subsp. pepo TaxID=3664 RepID=UPI000C9D89EA|nr:EG45-like domain containing protein 2 [Cucurbita pepo subsp. pepo]XP_023546129.1 EG45-like domain containing protein 2 [Cucurbita pepo subsp. pepo]
MFISRPQNNPLQWRRLCFFLFLFLSHLLHFSQADLGTASRYPPPYSPTECFGGDLTQFPTSNLFAAAGDGVWENGAACGRQYFVRCFSASDPEACVPDQTIQITIVDYAPSIVSVPTATGTTMILSTTAYNSIVNTSATVNFVTVEFLQV